MHDEDAQITLLDVCSRRVLVLDIGPREAPAVVLLHSLGLDHGVWWKVATRLAPQFRVIVPDMAGHGRNAGQTLIEDIASAADDVAEILTALGIEKAAIAGLSMGGGIAQEFALRYPARSTHLIAVATLARGLAAFEARAEMAEQGGMAAVVDVTLLRWFRPEDLALDTADVAYARRLVLNQPVTAWAAAWRALSRLNTQERLPGLRIPALCIAGERDASTPPEVLQGIAQAIPDARMRVVAGAPHLLTLTHPDEVAALLADFIAFSAN